MWKCGLAVRCPRLSGSTAPLDILADRPLAVPAVVPERPPHSGAWAAAITRRCALAPYRGNWVRTALDGGIPAPGTLSPADAEWRLIGYVGHSLPHHRVCLHMGMVLQPATVGRLAPYQLRRATLGLAAAPALGGHACRWWDSATCALVGRQHDNLTAQRETCLWTCT